MGTEMSLFSPISTIIESLVGTLEPFSPVNSIKLKPNQVISLEVANKLTEFEEPLQKLTLLHIIELELGQRESDQVKDYELEILEKRIDELEKEVTKKKEKKISSKIVTDE